MNCRFLFSPDIKYSQKEEYNGFIAIHHPSKNPNDIFWVKIDNEKEEFIIENIKTGGQIILEFESLVIPFGQIEIAWEENGALFLVGDVEIDFETIKYLNETSEIRIKNYSQEDDFSLFDTYVEYSDDFEHDYEKGNMYFQFLEDAHKKERLN